MQATCIQRECPKWRIPNSNESTLNNLPNELLVEIFQHLGWKDVFVMRRTCKLFFDISTSRPLWVCLFYRLSSEVQIPLILERPISRYSSKELEYVVMRHISSEVRWATGAPPRVRVHPMPDWHPEEEDQVVLLDGGRWLLTCMRRESWHIHAYDLDTLSQEPYCIIDLDHTQQGWHLGADIDRGTTSGLAFILCLIPWSAIRPLDLPSDWAPDQIHIYRLNVNGHGTEAFLEANKLKSLQNDLPAMTEMVDLRGNFLVRSLYDIDSTFCHFEVCNWLLSDSNVQFKSYLRHDSSGSGSFDDVTLISDDKAAVVSDGDISLYNISNLHPISAGNTINEVRIIEPYWKLTDPMLSREFQYSIPYPDLYSTRMTIVADGFIYGLIVPHESGSTPTFQRISDVNVSDLSTMCLSRNKIYAHNTNEGGSRTLNFLWPSDEDANRDVSLLPAIAQPSQHHVCLPHEWEEDEPLFDDSSNRILLFADNSWIVVDFGYK